MSEINNNNNNNNNTDLSCPVDGADQPDRFQLLTQIATFALKSTLIVRDVLLFNLIAETFN